MMEKLRVWAREPTTITGLATILGTLSALLSHQLTWAQAVPLLVGATVSILLPDNSSARAGAVAFAGAVVTTILRREEKK